MSDIATTTFTDEQRQLLKDIDEPDVPELGPPMFRMQQPNSQALIRENKEKYVPGAEGGMLLCRLDDKVLLYTALTPIMPLFFALQYVERTPDDKKEFIRIYNDGEKPEVYWVKDPRLPKWENGCFIKATRNRLDSQLMSVFMHKGGLAGYIFASTSEAIGKKWARQAFGIKGADGVHGYVAGFWSLTGTRVSRDNNSWYQPTLTLLEKGRYGEESGPTLAEVMLGGELRKGFRDSGSWGSLEAPEPPPEQQARPSITVSSRQRTEVFDRGEPPISAYEQDEQIPF